MMMKILSLRSVRQRFSMLYLLLTLMLLMMSCHDDDHDNNSNNGLMLAQQQVYESKEYCQLEQFRANCPDDHVVLIHSAVYGRMRLGKCVKKNYGSLGCSTDVMGHVDRLCSGRPSCQFQVATLHVVNSCPGDLTPFLEARFTCVSVATAYDQKCLDSNPIIINIITTPQSLNPSTPSDYQTNPTTPPLRATAATNRRESLAIAGDGKTPNLTSPLDLSPFLSSHISSSLGRGSSECPWQLRVPAGQQINVTLFNFGRVPAPSEWSSGGFSPSKPCHNLAVFRERQSTHVLTQCEGSARLVHAYLSQGNVLEVEIRPPKSSDLHFLLHYQAVGCANPPTIHGATFRRSGEFGIMRCNATQEVHRLHCVDSKWRGMNCSWPSLPLSNLPPSGQTEDFWGMSGLFSQETFPYSILLVVSIGVALGVFIGGVLLVCTTKFLKRRRGDNNNSLLQLHRHDYVISPQHHSNSSPYPPSVHHHQHHHQHLPPPHPHHQLLHHHPDDVDSIYRSGDKLATRDAQPETPDATITQLKNFPCSAGDIQLQKLLHHHQQQQQQQHCDFPDAEYFYAPRHSFGSCPLDATTTTTTTATVVGLSSNVAFYGEVLQAMEKKDGNQERKTGRCQFRVCANDRLTPQTSAGILCAGAVKGGKLKNCPIDLA